jgi:hypothetical protein
METTMGTTVYEFLPEDLERLDKYLSAEALRLEAEAAKLRAEQAALWHLLERMRKCRRYSLSEMPKRNSDGFEKEKTAEAGGARVPDPPEILGDGGPERSSDEGDPGGSGDPGSDRVDG